MNRKDQIAGPVHSLKGQDQDLLIVKDIIDQKDRMANLLIKAKKNVFIITIDPGIDHRRLIVIGAGLVHHHPLIVIVVVVVIEPHITIVETAVDHPIPKNRSVADEKQRTRRSST